MITSSNIILNNSLNIIVSLEIDSLVFNDKLFKKGSLIKDISTNSEFILINFELRISRYGEELIPSIMVMGNNEGINIEYADVVSM